jgi:hypothetical protein
VFRHNVQEKEEENRNFCATEKLDICVPVKSVPDNDAYSLKCKKKREKLPTTTQRFCATCRQKKTEGEIMRLLQEFFWKNWSKVVMFEGNFFF